MMKFKVGDRVWTTVGRRFARPGKPWRGIVVKIEPYDPDDDKYMVYSIQTRDFEIELAFTGYVFTTKVQAMRGWIKLLENDEKSLLYQAQKLRKQIAKIEKECNDAADAQG